jgi:hypothetical protein
MHVRGMGWCGMDRIDRTNDKDQGRVIVKMVMNCQVV